MRNSLKNDLKNKPLLHVGCPNIGDRIRFLERVEAMLERRLFSNNGPYVQEFEAAIAEQLNVRNCVCVCNATIGLEIAIHSLGIQGEIIVPAFTFVATAHAPKWIGLKPVFVDSDPVSHNIDVEKIENLISEKTSAILATHVWGRPCAIAELENLAKRHKLRLIFDAAHAFGCSYKGRMIGGFGDAEVFSFHATKFVNSFEGGAITTNDDELAKTLRLSTNFGFSGFDNVVQLGTNGKMTEVCAAMGLTSLESIHSIVAKNRENYECYAAGLAGIRGLSLVRYDDREKVNYQYVVIEVDELTAGISRDQIVARLHEQNILARKYFWPGCHQMEPYRSGSAYSNHGLLQTESIASRVIVLPTGQTVDLAAVREICRIIREAMEGNAGS